MSIQAGSSVLNLLGSIAGAANNVTPIAGEKPKRESAKYWANIGYYVDVPQADGTTKRTFVSLALGVPLDDIKEIEVRSNSSPEWKNLAAAKNQLRAQMLEAAAGFEPGEHKHIPQLCVELTRAGETTTAVEAADGSNPFAMAKAVKF